MSLRNNKDNSHRLLFYNDYKLEKPFDPEFIQLWSEISVPDQIDLQHELEKAGLKTMEVFDPVQNRKDSSRKKAQQKRFRRTKITNTHLDIDLTKDYVPEGK